MKIPIKSVVGLFLCCGLVGSLRVQSQTLPSRIIEAIDDDSVVRLENTTDIRIGTAADEGRVSPDLPMERMLLMLRSSPEQEAVLVSRPSRLEQFNRRLS